MQNFKLPLILGLSSIFCFLTNPAMSAGLKVDEVTLERFQGKGCGMTLWRLNRKASNHYVFFNGIQENSMEMSINGKIQKFTRIKGNGEQFYGQMTSQTFQNKTKQIIVEVDVALGKKIDAEVIAISKGTIRVKRNTDILTMAVRGNAGC
jgi:hypothetical protein